MKKFFPPFLALLFLLSHFETTQAATAPGSNPFSSALPSLTTLPKPGVSTTTSAPGSSTSSAVGTNPLGTNPVDTTPSTPASSTSTGKTKTPNFSGFSGFSNTKPTNTPFPNLLTLPATPFGNSAGLNPNENNSLPVDIECDIARLLVLEDDPVVVADGSTPFAVVASVYASLLNLFATDDPSQQIMYTDKVKPYIEQHVDEKGNCTYTVLPDQVNTLLGYSHCLSATTFRDVLCKDQSTLLALDANVDSNQQTYFWIHFTTTFLLPEDHSDNGLTHYQWISHTGMGNYYDFYFTKDHPANLSLYFSNADNLCIRSLTGNIWVGSRDNTNPTHDWTVTNDKLRGLLTSSDGKPFVIEASTDPADSTSPSPTEPTQPSNNSDQPISTNTKNHNGSSWEDFNRNGAGSSWEAYLQQSQARASSSPSYQNKNNVRPNPSSPTSPSPASPDNNASQQNPTVDKETESKIALAIKLAQEGKSLDQIESATGFTEAQLNVIFSRLSQ